MTILQKIGGAIAAAILLATAIPQAHAGPATQVFTRVTSEKMAETIKPGDRVAVMCPGCGAITVVTVNKDRSILSEFTCPNCHKVFRSMSVGSSGKTHTSGGYALVDSDGEAAHLAVLR